MNRVGYKLTDYLKGSNSVDIVSYALTIPHQAFMIFQAMCVILTSALISGVSASSKQIANLTDERRWILQFLSAPC